MSSALPFRSRGRNIGCAIAAPAALTILATKANGPDACEVVLRGEVDAAPAAATRFALLVLDAACRRHGAGVDVQVIAADGALLFVCSAITAEGGAA